MNIKQAKEQIKIAMQAYFTKDAFGGYRIPIEKQRPIFLMGPPGIGKTAIMEDRTESVLHHAEKWETYLKKRGRNGSTLNSKIVYIQKQMESNRNDLLNRYFSNDLLDRILVWKEDRNRLIHALLKQQLGHNEVSELATQGKQLVDELRKRAGNYNRAMERRKEKKHEQSE